ncbi:MAG: hypothetical protein JO368_00565 [Acidimicrobiales bacterium]|nr:hypothetical protein [Acidimicrobiales bacterium]
MNRLSQDLENRVKVGFFSLTHSSPTGDDSPYLTWHQLDHMPEQYRLPGVVAGQRWASTPDNRQVRAVATEGWSSVQHVVCYLMGEPVDPTVDAFLSLGRELAEVGRYPVAMPNQYRGALRLRQARAAPRVLVSDAVVPFRPHRGIYLVVEGARDGGSGDVGGVEEFGALGDLPDESMDALLETPGVAGVWVYATSGDLRRSMFSPGDLRITVCYLDDDPNTVAGRLGDLVGRLGHDGSRVQLAAPFESIVRWDWEHPGAT